MNYKRQLNQILRFFDFSKTYIAKRTSIRFNTMSKIIIYMEYNLIILSTIKHNQQQQQQQQKAA